MFLRILVLSLVMVLWVVLPATAQNQPYQTSWVEWKDLTTWQRKGTALARDGSLKLDPSTAEIEQDPFPAGGYKGRNFYTGGSYRVGEAISPPTINPFPFFGALASWGADTPPGTWIETQIRSQRQGRWTRWYNAGVWAADGSTIQRHSVDGQEDVDGEMAVDTLILKEPASAYQLKVRLFGLRPEISPSLRRITVATSTIPAKPQSLSPGDPRLWNRILALPQCSQMVYPDGGEVWCSPTSVAMVLAYWRQDKGPCEPQVRAAVDGVYDWVYDGHGNWLFNTAYAATQGLSGSVARFTSLAQLEPWIGAGVPVVFSFAWKEGELSGAAIPKSNGHLAVLVGFDAAGNPVVNDPAASNDAEVQRIYNRTQLETLWLQYSGGTVYLIYPPDRTVPQLG